MVVKKKLKLTKALIAASFFITIIAIFTPVIAVGSTRVLFVAIGDDMDINATNLIIGKIDFGEDDELPSVKAVFHQRIYDDSGKKVYTMMGMLKDGALINSRYYFYCPICNCWWINVSQVVGTGVYKTSDTNLDLTYRKWFDITMPNTKGKYVEAPMLMFLSPTAEYCKYNPATYPPGSSENPIDTDPEGAWVLIAVFCGIMVEPPGGGEPMPLPIGPVSYLTISIGI
jgi:hypothetical protein